RIGQSLKIGATSGIASLLFISAVFWTPECPGCDRSALYLLAPAWATFALVGSITELGLPSQLRFPKLSGWLGSIRMEDARRVGLALVMAVCLWRLVARRFSERRVLHAYSLSPTRGSLSLRRWFPP